MGMVKNLVVLVIGVLAACKGREPERHAVGTYIGGGSVVFGASGCSYTAEPGVLDTDPGGSTSGSRTGPQFVIKPGRITEICGNSKQEVLAVVPTGLTILYGPTSIKVGEQTWPPYTAKLVAGKHVLDGDPVLGWELGPDCAGVADFAPVLGSQDTGGPDRSRKLIAKRAGSCKIIATATTQSPLHESFTPQTFRAELAVRVR